MACSTYGGSANPGTGVVRGYPSNAVAGILTCTPVGGFDTDGVIFILLSCLAEGDFLTATDVLTSGSASSIDLEAP